MIETTLNRAAAEKLFNDNAIIMSGRDVVPDYIVYELFGMSAVRLFENRGENRLFKGGIDFIFVTSDGKGMIDLFTRTGFLEFVSLHNYAIIEKARSASPIAAAADQLRAEKIAEIERQDAEIAAKKTRGEGEA